MYIPAAFFENGAPKTGLTPTITIYDLSDNSKVVNAKNMTEVAEGGYKYNFTTRDITKSYYVICDSVTLTGGDRYAVSDIEVSPLSAVLEGTTTFTNALRIILAAVAGLSTGFGSKNIAYRDVADSKDRIVGKLDRKGNRTGITLDGS